MRNFIKCVFVLAIACTGTANAQYVDDSRSGPLFGGPGDYYYPLVCSQCTVWQDYRNFAWNQLSIVRNLYRSDKRSFSGDRRDYAGN